METAQAPPAHLQAMHDSVTGADVACLGGRAIVAVKLALLRRAVIAAMIQRAIEPDEPGISRVADATAAYTILVVDGGGLAIRDVTGRPTADMIAIELGRMAVEARQAAHESKYPYHYPTGDPNCG